MLLQPTIGAIVGCLGTSSSQARPTNSCSMLSRCRNAESGSRYDWLRPAVKLSPMGRMRNGAAQHDEASAANSTTTNGRMYKVEQSGSRRMRTTASWKRGCARDLLWRLHVAHDGHPAAHERRAPLPVLGDFAHVSGWVCARVWGGLAGVVGGASDAKPQEKEGWCRGGAIADGGGEGGGDERARAGAGLKETSRQ
jgi:hypothetical protein